VGYFYSMHICNFRTLRHGSCTNCQQRLLAAFRFFRVFFVSLLCLPHTFFRRGPVLVLLIIKIFLANQQVTFSRLDKFENNFWIVVKGRFCSGNVPVSVGNGENANWPKGLWFNLVCKKKLPEQLGLHCYAVSTHPDEFFLSSPLKIFLDPPMKSQYFLPSTVYT